MILPVEVCISSCPIENILWQIILPFSRKTERNDAFVVSTVEFVVVHSVLIGGIVVTVGTLVKARIAHTDIRTCYTAACRTLSLVLEFFVIESFFPCFIHGFLVAE